MSTTSIEWATHVWNPVTGCDRVSPGCAHCYALTYAARLKAMGQAKYQRDGGRASGPGFGLTLHPSALEEPERWRKPRRVFVNSMSDLFHEQVPIAFIETVFGRMAGAAAHDFLVLTKRAERMAEVLNRASFAANALRASGQTGLAWPAPNVWLGVSIENRRYVGRADLLRATPAAVRFISAEPLLGPLVHDTDLGTMREGDVDPEKYAGDAYTTCFSTGDPDAPQLDLEGIDWLIVGGESGPAHRPIKPEWVRDLRDQAELDDTAFFFKQWGGRTPKAGGRELDGRTWDELPRTRAAA